MLEWATLGVTLGAALVGTYQYMGTPASQDIV